jgi:hypothetical protein
MKNLGSSCPRVLESSGPRVLESSYTCSARLAGLQARLQSGFGDRVERADGGARE